MWPLRPLQHPNSMEDKSDLSFEISDIIYLDIHAHIAYMVWALFVASESSNSLGGHCSLQTASEVKSEISDLNYLCDL